MSIEGDRLTRCELRPDRYGWCIRTDSDLATLSHANDPLICAAGVASLDVVEQEDIPAKARRIGALMRERLEALARRYEMIGDVRGRGQLMGIELVRDRASREPATDEGREIGRICFQSGVIFSLRRNGSVPRFVPPATTTEAQIVQFAEVLDRALDAVSAAGNRHQVGLPG